MDYFVEQARTDGEVHAIIRRKYGDRARILSRKEVRVGGFLGMFQHPAVEVSGYFSHAPIATSQRGTMAEERRKILEHVGARTDTPVPVERDDVGPAAETTAEQSDADRTPVTAGIREGRLRFSNHAGSPDPTLGEILSELRTLKESVGVQEPSIIAEVRELLEANDFSRGYVDEILAELRRECTIEELTNRDAVLSRVAARIERSIELYPWRQDAQKPRVFVLVGPTGVGKTTTIAKLAAMYGAVSDPRHDVRVITIDSYRIGAFYQIEKYGEIMNIPVVAVETADEMRKQLAISREADYVFIDTIGKSPHDLARLAEVNELVRAAAGEVHLAISATTKYRDILDTLRQFEPFDYRAVVVTKLDETSCVGGIVSALHEKRKSVSFITDGQSVPQDIERARTETFLRRLRDIPIVAGESADNRDLVRAQNEE